MDREALTIVTWNVRHGSPTRAVVRVVEQLLARDPDVLCLQEVALWSLTPPRRNLHAALLGATGWHGAIAAHPHRYRWWAEGVSVLTPHPVLAREVVRLSRLRALVRLRLQSPRLGLIDVGCLHLSEPALRARELAAAAAAMPAAGGILAGDFNLSLPAIETLGAAPGGYRPDGCAPSGVDRVFVSRDLEAQRCEQLPCRVSDHDPVLVRVVPRRTSAAGLT